MAGTTQATVAVATPEFAKRKARAIIAWLTENEGALWLAGRDMQAATNPALIARCVAMRRVALARPAIGAEAGIVLDLPSSAAAHVAALEAHPLGQQIILENGRPALVDLTRVRAFQPIVHIVDAQERFAGIDLQDIAAIARVTIPIPPKEPQLVPANFDPVKLVHTMTSPNPNLRVMGALPPSLVEIAPGLRFQAFGFVVGLLPSYLSVACVAGKYFLTDGYHRAIGLLASNVSHAPALVRDYDSPQHVPMPPGMLTSDVFLGDHAPLLPDYLNDQVSVETLAPIVTKTIVIQGLEITPLG